MFNAGVFNDFPVINNGNVFTQGFSFFQIMRCQDDGCRESGYKKIDSLNPAKDGLIAYEKYRRKVYYRRKEGKIIAEGKMNNKTIFLFTVPEVSKLAESSLFAEEKKSNSILMNINLFYLKK